MNNFQIKVDDLIEEIRKLEQQYAKVQSLDADNKIEQEKIVEQNRTIKHQIEQLQKSQADVLEKEHELFEREKQIVIKEKSLVNANKLLDAKLIDYRTKLLQLTTQEEKLKKDTQNYQAQKKLIDERAFIIKEREDADTLRKEKFKIKEQEIDSELERLKTHRL